MNPEYNKWDPDIQAHYDKISNNIIKHGHSINGVVQDGRPFAYTIGASLSINAEFLCFFPVEGKGLSIISTIMNRIIQLVKSSNFTLKSQIINDKHIYGLPLAMVSLVDDMKLLAESKWACQLERDGFLSEFSTEDHELFLLIASDKEGKLPWEPECGSFWPDICPRNFVEYSETVLINSNKFIKKKTQEDKSYYTTIRNVRYPLLAEISPNEMIDAYKIGKEKWELKYPKGNYNLLLNTLTSLFKNEVVVTQVENNNFMYFDVNNIPDAFRDDFPNKLFKPDNKIRDSFIKNN